MEYDEMAAILSQIAERYETTLHILSDAIGFEFTEKLLNPFFEHILPGKDVLEAEGFLQAIEAVAAKLVLYRDATADDFNFKSIENFVLNFEAPPAEG